MTVEASLAGAGCRMGQSFGAPTRHPQGMPLRVNVGIPRLRLAEQVVWVLEQALDFLEEAGDGSTVENTVIG